ncbi:MAG: PAS domain S-box protein [Spartobacteria bacterium]|nr:PAS domain S-box protein [Spartobacteria bacterium]
MTDKKRKNPRMNQAFIDKVIERLDLLDSGSLQVHFLRLAQEKGLMETVLQAIQEGIILIDEHGIIMYANHSAGKLLGFNHDEIAGKEIGRIFREIEWEALLKLEETEWSRIITREVETFYPRHGYLNFYIVPLTLVSSSSTPLATHNDLEGAVILIRDITLERQNTAEVMESERLQAITLLAASVAHEIGNPLNSLTIHLQLLHREMNELSRSEDTEALQELLHVASHEVERLDQILNQFLSALRPVPLELTRLHIDTVLQECLDFLAQEISDRYINLKVTAEETTPSIQGDANQLKQVFFNLIRNAIQSMTPGGQLTVELTSNDRFVIIAFVDTGSGISPEHMGHIFEPFQTTKHDGNGLGLMIVQRIIRDHGGEIEIQSKPDQGSTFTIHLPREDRRIRLLNAPQKEPTEEHHE